MKARLGIITLGLVSAFAMMLLAADSSPSPPVVTTRPTAGHGIDSAQRFIFYSVLEGLYEDGLSTNDVNQILLPGKGIAGGPYAHFVYACPICNPTIWALQAYQAHPPQLYSLKNGMNGTFGPGLSDDLHTKLYSDDIHERLSAINILLKSWVQRRLDRENLSDKERADLTAELKKMRDEGGQALHRTSAQGQSDAAVTECAACNGAVGMDRLGPSPNITEAELSQTEPTEA